MTREEQFEQFEYFFTYEPDLNHFEIAFMAHYKMLDNMIEYAAQQVIADMKKYAPRAAYAEFYENTSMIYSQLCITIECLLKMVLHKSGYEDNKLKTLGHKLCNLYDELIKGGSAEACYVYGVLSKHKQILNYLSDNIFVNSRYMLVDSEMAVEHMNKIWDIILALDEIYKRLYSNFDLENNVYPDSM